jgi:hypothetical protein
MDSKLQLTIQPDLLVQYTRPGLINSSSALAGNHKLARKCYKLSDTTAAAAVDSSSTEDRDRDREEVSEQQGGEMSGRAVLVVIRHPFAASIVDEAQSVLNNYKRYCSSS